MPYLPAEHVEDENRVTAPPGFQVRRLLLLGAKQPDAELRFEPGLNVIVGPSNAGKSFAFYLLDYAFGATKLRKLPEEGRPYNEVVVEIVSAAGEPFTIRRNIGSGVLRWYDVPFDRIGEPGVQPKVLARKHTEGKATTISAQFLALSKLSGRRLRMNSDNLTGELTFRQVLKLCCVDESRIVQEGSPIWGPNPNANTPEKSCFELLLSGRDASNLVRIENPAARRNWLRAQADLLDDMLAQGAYRPKSAPTVAAGPAEPDAAELARQRAALDETIARLEAELATVSESVDSAYDERDAINALVVGERSRLLVIGELLARFELLRQSYRSDLDRLAFLEAGSELLQQLPIVTCPTCGQPIEPGHTHGTPAETSGDASNVRTTNAANDAPGITRRSKPSDPINGDAVRIACEAEARSIQVLLRDLEMAVSDLVVERETLTELVRQRASTIHDIERRVEDELRSRLVAATTEMRRSVGVRQQLIRQETTLQHRASLLERRYEIAHELDRIGKRAPKLEPPPREEVDVEPLNEQIRALLDAWLVGAGTVRFNRDEMDFVIGGRPRAEQGKGVRAIWFSAFIVALMRLCRKESRPHPGFVMLDSPLTTFRGSNRPLRGPEDVSETVEQAFFRHLAKTSASASAREQIIIFDNKEPPSDVAEYANVVQFTGPGGGGREGFVPRPDGSVTAAAVSHPAGSILDVAEDESDESDEDED